MVFAPIWCDGSRDPVPFSGPQSKRKGGVPPLNRIRISCRSRVILSRFVLLYPMYHTEIEVSVVLRRRRYVRPGCTSPSGPKAGSL